MTKHLLVLLVALLCIACSTAPAAPIATVVPLTTMIDPSAAETVPGGPVFDGTMWMLGTSTAPLRYPLQADVGTAITEWIVFLQRDTAGAPATARLQCLEVVASLRFDVGPAVEDALQGPGYVALHMPACPQDPPRPCMTPAPISEDCSFSIELTGAPGNRAGAAAVYTTRL